MKQFLISFFLVMLFGGLTYGLVIDTGFDNAIQYIRTIYLTDTGNDSGTTGVVLWGDTSSVRSDNYCDSAGDDCFTPSYLTTVLSGGVASSIHTHTASDIVDFITAVRDTETTTSLTIQANTLRYTDEDGVVHDYDLSLYLDDTNLARIISGVYVPGDNVLQFTRDDMTTFDVDASAFFDDTNLVTSVANKTGAVTLVEADITDLDKYTQVQVDTLLAGKSNTGHNHTASEITNFDTAVNNNITVTTNTSNISTNTSTIAGKLDDITAGTNITIDKTDPNNPIINSAALGGGVTPVGANGDVQYNNSGIFGGSSDLNFNDNTRTLNINGSLTTTSNGVSGKMFVQQANPNNPRAGFTITSTNNNPNNFGFSIRNNQPTTNPRDIFLEIVNANAYDPSVHRGTIFVKNNVLDFNSFKGNGSNAGERITFTNDRFGGIPTMTIGSGPNLYNVGIGTSTPTEKLEVNGTIKATDINFTGLPIYADDAAAGVGGLVAGDVYQTPDSFLKIKN